MAELPVITFKVDGIEMVNALRAERQHSAELEKLLKEAQVALGKHHDVSLKLVLGDTCPICQPKGTDFEDALLMRISRELKPTAEQK